MKSKALIAIKKALTYNIAYAIFSSMNQVNIKSIRKKLKLTQEQFAEKIGVAFCTVNRWEKNHSEPSKLAMKEILKLIKKYK